MHSYGWPEHSIRTRYARFLAVSIAAYVILLSTPSSAREVTPEQLTLPEATAVAVFIFSNATGEAANDWMGVGIAETIAADLDDVDGIRVVRTTPSEVGRFPSTSARSLVAIARELQTHWIISGSYERLEDRIRITAHLTDVETTTVVRSAIAEGTIDELFSLQDELVIQIRDSLSLSSDEGMPVPTSPVLTPITPSMPIDTEAAVASGGPPAVVITGYLQTVPLWTDSTQLAKSNVASFNRFRLSAEPMFDIAGISFNIAYEQMASFQQRSLVQQSRIGTVPSGGEWLKLEWTIDQDNHVLWRHRFDRLNLVWSPATALELTVGRQAISWGTTLFLTPADPFSPFSPSDPFRVFRGGVDAARLRIYPTSLSEIDIVVRPTDTDAGEELTALARWLGTWNNWELSTWGGSLYGDVAWAFGSVGSWGRWAIRTEAVVRQFDESLVFRGTAGIDRLFQVGGRDLMVLTEYQRDGFGATTPDEYLNVGISDPSRRGELQVLGRDEIAFQTSYQLHPLWNVATLWLWNLNDRSALLSPSFAYSLSNEASLSGGIFFGIGADTLSLARPLPSEYGLSGTTAFLSATWFF